MSKESRLPARPKDRDSSLMCLSIGHSGLITRRPDRCPSAYSLAAVHIDTLPECGAGVSQNYIQAHMWMSPPAVKSSFIPIGERTLCEIASLPRWPPAQIAEAQRMAKERRRE